MRPASLVLGAALLMGVSLPAVAEARPVSHGIFAEGGMGVTGVIGPNQPYVKPGPTMNIRVGYDLWSWLSLGLQLAASNHEATVPPPPEGEWFQLYRGGADGRMGFRAGALSFYAEGDLDGVYISSNVLGKVGITDPGEHFSIDFQAGGGIEYQIQNRHYAFGLAGDWWLMPLFDALTGIDMRLYLRYTTDGL
jgi:hypothetical protein